MTVIAHRSGPSVYPEQTIDSAIYSNESGADLIEVDARFSLDNKIIICHDHNAERVFGRYVDIKELTADEFCSLPHKDNPDYHGYLLEDYLKAGVLNLLIHVKEEGKIISDIIDLLSRYEALDSSVLGIMNTEDVTFARNIYPAVKILGFIPNEETMDDFIDSGADYIRLWEKEVSLDKIDYIHSKGKKVWVMVYDKSIGDVGETSSRFIDYIKDSGADGILINDVRNLTV